MNPANSKGVAPAPPGPATVDLFEAPSYADFVRAAMRIKASRTEVTLLFESTASEPTAELVKVASAAFSPELTSRYVSVFADGNRYAIEAVARRYGLSPSQIITTTGATGAINLILKALIQSADSRVLIERPGFDMLTRLAADAGAAIDYFERPAPDYRIHVESLRARLTSRTRVVLLTNLHNPSGALLPAEDIVAVARAAATVGAVVVVDEVYSDFVTPTPPPAATLARNILSVSSLTKVFGLFALKFGWLAGDEDLVQRIRQSAPDGDFGVSKLSHAVAAHVLETPDPFEAHWRAALSANQTVVREAVAALVAEGLLEGELPAFGCMYFPKVPGHADTRALARRLLAEFDVLVAPGEFFDAPGYVRLGYGSDPASIEMGLAQLQKGLRALRL